MKMKLDFREKTSLNIATNLARTLAMALVGIFMTPYYVDNLGIAAYAIIPLATSMASYIQIISDSLAYATIRYTTLAFNTGDKDEINKTFNSAFFGLGRICLMLVPIAILVSIASPALFDITGNTGQEVQVMFALILLSSIIVTHSVTFEGAYYSTNDLYLLYTSRFAYTISQVATIVLLFAIEDTSLVDIGIGYLTSSIIVYALQLHYAKRLFPEMKIRNRFFDRKLFKKMGSLGIWSIVAKVGGLMYMTLSIVLVNIYLGSTEEGGFALVATVISMINTACYTITGSIDPYLYKCYSENRKEDMIQIARTGTKITVVAIAFPMVFLIVFTEEFLDAWMGGGYGYLSDIVVIGCIGNLAFCAVSAIACIQKIFLKIHYPAFVTVGLGILNAALLCTILPGENSTLIQTIIIWAFCVTSLALFNAIYTAFLTGAKWYAYLTSIVTGYLIIAVWYLPLKLIQHFINIPGQWLPLIVVGLVTYAVYLLVMYIVLFSAKEKDLVSSLLPRAITRCLPKRSMR